MWAVGVGKREDLCGMSGSRVAEYLSELGVSPAGVLAVRDNQVDGEMFIELTDNDIKDLFSIFKDRHIVRKLLQGRHMTAVTYAERTSHPDQHVSTHNSTHCIPQEVNDVDRKRKMESSDCGGEEPAADCKDPPSSFHGDVNASSCRPQTNPWYLSPERRESSYKAYDSYHSYLSHQRVNHEFRGSEGHSVSPEWIASHPNRLGNPVSHFGTRLLSEGDAKGDEVKLPSRQPSEALAEFEASSAVNVGSQARIGSNSTLLTHRLAPFSGLELLSRKTKQGKPNEAQRFGQMVIREASSRAGMWEEAPCLQQITEKQKTDFFEHSFSMAPNLVNNRDLLWKRLGEALLNRRKYLRDKVLGKRGKRLGEQTLQELDLDYCGSPESVKQFDRIDEQLPDTSSLHLRRQWAGDLSSGKLSRSGVSSTQEDSSDVSALRTNNCRGEDDQQTYPDSTMDVQSSDSECEGNYLHGDRPRPSHQAPHQHLFSGHSLNLSILSSAACSALLKEEAVLSKSHHEEQIFHAEITSVESDDEPVNVKSEPAHDIEKVNLHKRLFTSKYEFPVKDKQPRRTGTGFNAGNARSTASHTEARVPTDSNTFPVSLHHCLGAPPVPKHLQVWEHPDTITDMRLYSTIDQGIANYSGEDLLERKSKQGKPSEPQRLGQQVIRESAMIAKLWQDVPDSIKAINSDQKRVFFQCAFTLAPNLIGCRDLLWRRLGEALQNRRKYVRDRSLGKRPTKREQRLMNETQRENMESDSQTSLSSIHDIQNIVRRVFKQETLQE